MDTAPYNPDSRLPTWVACLCAFLLVAASVGFAAADHYGQVSFAGLPVPGATITASQGDKQIVTSTDQQGIYKLPDLADGVWTIRIEMLGFSTITQDVMLAPDSPPSMWELTLRPFEEIAREIPPRAVQPAPTIGTAVRPKSDATGTTTNGTTTSGASGSASPPAGAQRGFQRAGVNASSPPPVTPNATASTADAATGDSPFGAADGLLINGSVNNGAASPFAQLAAFGNNRRSARSLYTGGAAVILGNSAFDARPFSFAGQDTAKPEYTDVQVAGQFGGPLKIPWLFKNPSNVFVGYQRTSNHDAITQPALMPTSLERAGDFSQSRDASGRPVQIVDPATGAPFPGGVIPRDRISPQAASLLGYYPLPNLDAGNRYNFQAPLVTVTRQDSIQTRITQPPFGRNQTYGNVAYQRTTTESTNVFGFTDATTVSGIDTAINWSRRFSQFFSLRLRYQFTRLATEVTPYFANRTNVSGEAGIGGNNQDPVNWGPPSLSFASGVEGLSSAQYASNSNLTHVWSAESTSSRGRHNITFGGGVHRQQVDVLSQQNARGAFTFTGAATGSDLADFLLGHPPHQLDSVWQCRQVPPRVRVRGLRHRRLAAESGAHHQRGRSLGVRSAVYRAVRAAGQPGRGAWIFGGQLGRRGQSGGCADRLALSGIAGPSGPARCAAACGCRVASHSRFVVGRQGGYGVYRNTNVYQSIALMLAQQPPFSKAFTVQNSAANPLTLANGFVAPAGGTPNTFAVDPDFRVGYCRELAGVGPEGSARVAHDSDNLPRDKREPVDAGDSCPTPTRRARSIPVPSVPRDSSTSHRTDARSDTRVRSSCGAASATA